MATAIFWRVRFLQSSGGLSSNIWLDEVEFLNSASELISASGGYAVASSEYVGGAYPAVQAFDGITATNGWSGAAGAWPQWIGYAFPAPVEPAFIRLTMPENASASDELPQGVVLIDQSADGVTWIENYFGFLVSGAIAVGQVVVLKIAERQPARGIGTIHRTPDVGFDSGPLQITGTTKNTGTPNAPVRRARNVERCHHRRLQLHRPAPHALLRHSL